MAIAVSSCWYFGTGARSSRSLLGEAVDPPGEEKYEGYGRTRAIEVLAILTSGSGYFVEPRFMACEGRGAIWFKFIAGIAMVKCFDCGLLRALRWANCHRSFLSVWGFLES